MSHRDTHRLPLIDLLKVIGSQLIVLHHLAFYGPMADYAAPLMPALMGWLSDHARVVVQVFLGTRSRRLVVRVVVGQVARCRVW